MQLYRPLGQRGTGTMNIIGKFFQQMKSLYWTQLILMEKLGSLGLNERLAAIALFVWPFLFHTRRILSCSSTIGVRFVKVFILVSGLSSRSFLARPHLLECCSHYSPKFHSHYNVFFILIRLSTHWRDRNTAQIAFSEP
jgi:hypothetical protein